jgi:hypothetical protein
MRDVDISESAKEIVTSFLIRSTYYFRPHALRVNNKTRKIAYSITDSLNMKLASEQCITLQISSLAIQQRLPSTLHSLDILNPAMPLAQLFSLPWTRREGYYVVVMSTFAAWVRLLASFLI